MTRVHKVLIFILALGAVLGMGWNAISKADARYPKADEVATIHDELKTEIAMLATTFQRESLDRLIESKRDKIRDLNRRLRMRIPEDEKFEIKEDIKQYEHEIENLKQKQQNLK